MYSFAIALTVVSNVLYHLFQKFTPQEVNPYFALLVTYLTAAAGCLLLLIKFPISGSWLESFKELNYASYGLGVAIIGLEVGFLLAYRAGWNISLAALVSTVLVALVLLPVGMLLLQEKLSGVNALGIGLCLLGLVLINR